MKRDREGEELKSQIWETIGRSNSINGMDDRTIENGLALRVFLRKTANQEG
jgi:hypothetical protein